MKTLDNPHGIKREKEDHKVGTHYYVQPIYATPAILCPQCLRIQSFQAHSVTGASKVTT